METLLPPGKDWRDTVFPRRLTPELQALMSKALTDAIAYAAEFEQKYKQKKEDEDGNV